MRNVKKNSKTKLPKEYSLVKFDFTSLPTDYHKSYPFSNTATYVFFGEISNMPGHCVVADYKTGQIYSGYHTENFIELTKNEV